MPNWCSNSIEISNPKVFKEKCVKNGEFTFENVVPQPDHMKANNELGFDGELRKLVEEEQIDSTKIKFANKIPNSLFQRHVFDYIQVKPWLEAEEERTGVKANDWYEWNNANWGTKWDACQSTFDMEELEEAIANNDSYHFEFDTAWSPPLPVLDAMAKAGVQFDWSCTEEANFYAMEGQSDGEGFSCWDVEIQEEEEDEDEEDNA